MLFDNSIHVPEYIIIKVLIFMDLRELTTIKRYFIACNITSFCVMFFKWALTFERKIKFSSISFGNCWYVNILSNFLLRKCRESRPFFTILFHSIWSVYVQVLLKKLDSITGLRLKRFSNLMQLNCFFLLLTTMSLLCYN